RFRRGGPPVWESGRAARPAARGPAHGALSGRFLPPRAVYGRALPCADARLLLVRPHEPAMGRRRRGILREPDPRPRDLSGAAPGVRVPPAAGRVPVDPGAWRTQAGSRLPRMRAARAVAPSHDGISTRHPGRLGFRPRVAVGWLGVIALLQLLLFQFWVRWGFVA